MPQYRYSFVSKSANQRITESFDAASDVDDLKAKMIAIEMRSARLKYMEACGESVSDENLALYGDGGDKIRDVFIFG